MKKFNALIAFACAFVFVTGVGRTTTSVAEITSKLFELDGNVVEVKIASAFNPHQTSAGTFEFNIRDGGQTAVVLISPEKGRQLFPAGKRSAGMPSFMMVRVSHGKMQNEFGSVTEGPILYSTEWPPSEGPQTNNGNDQNGGNDSGQGKVQQLINSINRPSDWGRMSIADKKDFIRKQLISKGLSMSEAREAVENLNP